jgi:hypothetical protein
VLLSIVAAAVLAACVSVTQPAIAVPTLPPEPAGSPQACMAALIEGTLRADAEWGIALETTDGAKVKVLWPNGYSAREDDAGLALIDGSGTVVAHAGDQVQVGGGGSEEAWVGCGGVTVVDAG